MSITTEKYLSEMPPEMATDESIAQWVTSIISPQNVGVFLSCIMTLQYSSDPAQSIMWLLFIILFMTVPPLSYVYWLVHTGYLEDIYMPNRSKRLRPLSVTMAWLILSFMVMRFLGAPSIVESVTLITIMLVTVLSAVTLFWKISFHSAAISAASVCLIAMNGLTAVPSLLLIPVVGWSRVRLNRHTPGQVVMGCVAGIVITIIMLFFVVSQGLLTTA